MIFSETVRIWCPEVLRCHIFKQVQFHGNSKLRILCNIYASVLYCLNVVGFIETRLMHLATFDC